MNRFEGSGFREAKIRYLDGDYQILTAGSYVVCAMTGVQIPIDEPALLERRPTGTLCRLRLLARGRQACRRAAEPEPRLGLRRISFAPSISFTPSVSFTDAPFPEIGDRGVDDLARRLRIVERHVHLDHVRLFRQAPPCVRDDPAAGRHPWRW